MMVDSSDAAAVPLLRTLSPALRELGRGLRGWLDSKRRHPLSTIARANLDGLATDLQRQSEALQMVKPLLVIVLMGGTGVGKSTLLNAMAGGAIAQASFARPTTRDPVVYIHESIQPHRLDPALQRCKLVAHDRPELEQKILVDTPDLDSNDLANREKLGHILPVADVVLYVGSQEKYHDRLGWELFLQQRKRRAFAFVLNKWDRCLHSAALATGLRPDQDLMQDLQAEGFHEPKLFRTCAQYWVDQVSANGQPASAPVAGEQFQDLVRWLEMGLTRLEIEAIKARGVSQLLDQLRQALEGASPPDLALAAEKTVATWKDSLRDEARGNAEVLLATLEPYQKEIEHHFALERQRNFRGIMGWYLQWFNRLRYAGSSLRDRMPFLPKFGTKVDTPAEWDLAMFTRACTNAASDRHLDARGRALADRLLVQADREGFPVNLLADLTESAAKKDWRILNSKNLIDVLAKVECEWAKPTGARRLLQGTLVFLADWLPLLAFGAMGTILLWQYTMESRVFAWGDLLLPAMVVAMVILVLHVFISVFLPLRWPAIRSEFGHLLEERLQAEMEAAYCPLPTDVVRALEEEKRHVERLLGETREVAQWLTQREEAASIAGLYGK